jgi:hypothetical protein
MNQNPQAKGTPLENSGRPVTRDMLYARTTELALMAGRGSQQIKQVDYERAKYELTGELDFDRQQAMLDLTVAG